MKSSILFLAALMACGTLASAQTAPNITSVAETPTLVAGQNYYNFGFTINGSNFGSVAPYNGDNADLRLYDSTGDNFVAGTPSCTVTLNVTSWTNNQITVGGFTGAYGLYVAHPGDDVQISMVSPTNAQSSNVYQVPLAVVPTITSVTAVPMTIGAPNFNWAYTISGTNFGSMPGFNGNNADFRLTDETAGGWVGGAPGCTVGVDVTSWSDNQITIAGYSGAYSLYLAQPGDQMQLTLENPISSSTSTPFNFTLPVPEPSSLSLLAVGVVASLRRRPSRSPRLR